MPDKTDLMQGTLDLLILRTLRAGAKHGYAIASHIKETSDGFLQVEEGSLYPALHRMEQRGWLNSSWGVTEKSREARFYEITAAGRRQLAQERETWSQHTEGVQRVLGYA